jgi:hypothetical protein
MTRLILAMDDTGAGTLRDAGLADIVLPFGFRFVWGPLPSDAELVTAVAPRSAQHVQITGNWLWNVHRKHLGETCSNEIGLIDLCERCETIELWIDPDPNAQLTLIWLLDYLRHHAKIAPKLTLVQADTAIGGHLPEQVATWRLPAIRILNDHLEQASTAWRAYRAPTPQDWFNLLSKDLSILPNLRRAVVKLLEERNADASALIGRYHESYRALSAPPPPAKSVRLLGGRIAAGRVGALSGACCIRPRRRAVPV